MFFQTYSAALFGVEAVVICVEADVCDGLPLFSMVGYLASEVKEAKERIRVAVKNAGFLLEPKRITVNLSPADIRKEGTAYDLPAAVAILTAFGHISPEKLKNTILIGELSLDGSVRAINGALPILFAAKEKGFERCILPLDNLAEGSCMQGMELIGVKHLKEVVTYLKGEKLENTLPQIEKKISKPGNADFAEIAGQQAMKRAIVISAAGWHNLLMIGPPGSGKTMAARRLPTILPELTKKEAMEISKIYSAAGLLRESPYYISERPFRAPHHTISAASLAGGGASPKVGEISLAHGGVLFLDELPEFQKATLEVLRQPMEEGKIQIDRLHGSYSFPAKFLFVGAMNPCSCGNYPDLEKCTCSPLQRKRYISRVSGPLLDRIDICHEVPRLKLAEMKAGKGESSKDLRKKVIIARNIQKKRYEKEMIAFNGQLNGQILERYIKLDSAGERFLTQVFEKKDFSTRAYFRILKLARTIADLEESKTIEVPHLAEAVFYRSMDQKYWG